MDTIIILPAIKAGRKQARKLIAKLQEALPLGDDLSEDAAGLLRSLYPATMTDKERRELEAWAERTREAFRILREARRRLIRYQEARFGALPEPE
jgi:hypothetical protein